MSDLRFFQNPSFVQYVRLLSDLHTAIREGWDETAEGEALLERMDEPGSRLSREEIASLKGISADFYSLTEPPPMRVPPVTTEVMADLELARQAREWRDFTQALELLRKHAGQLPPANLAILRGQVWLEAGEPALAARFLQRASELDPDSKNPARQQGLDTQGTPTT